MQSPRPRRPVGIVLSAIALGLAAFVLVLLAVSGLVTALTGAQLPTAGPSAPPAAFFTAVVVGMTLVYLAFAGWAIGTLVGLVRMHSWARISTMVIAGCLAGLGLLSAVGMLGMQSIFASGAVPVPPNVAPAMLHKVFVAMAVMSLVMAVLGVVWLIYLAQRRTREAFAQAHAEQLAQPPSSHIAGYPHPRPTGAYPAAPPLWGRPQAPAPDPLTDFTVARPLETATPVESVPAAEFAQHIPPADSYDEPSDRPQQPQGWPQQPKQQQPWQPAAATAVPVRSGRPVSITVLAIFSLISAFFSLVGVVSPVPTFLFGVIVSGWPLHLYSVVWASAMAIAGLGMLRLQRPAWVLSFVLLGLSSLHFLVLLLPGPRARYTAYMAALQQHSLFGGAQPALPANLLAITLAAGMVFGLAVLVTFAIVLWRARWAFEPPAASATDDLEAS